MKRQNGLVIVMVLVLSGCSATVAAPAVTPTASPTATAVPSPQPLSPVEVVKAVSDRLNAGDLDGALALWADDAIWYIFGLPPAGSELIRGREAIRAEFEREIAGHLRWEVEPQSVVGNAVTSRDRTWLDFTRRLGVAPISATGQYLVEGGRIATYAWTVDPESLGRLKTALAAQAPSAPQPAPAAQAPGAAELKVVIAEGTCRTEGGGPLQAGPVELTMDVRDGNRSAYAVVFLTLQPGKDLADLMAASTGVPPAWAHPLHYEEVGPASTKRYQIRVTAGPLYGVCFSKPPDQAIGNLGPIAVVE